MSDMDNFYTGIIDFIKELERLKDTTRTAWTSQGRQESTAEHSFIVAMFVLTLKDSFPEMDLAKAIMLALVHDLGEAFPLIHDH